MTKRRGWILLGVLTALVAARSSKPQAGYRTSLFWRVYDRLSAWADRKWGWDRLPRWLGLLDLVGLRNVLRRENLHDTYAAPAVDVAPVPPFEERFVTERSADGSYNDLDDPAMGRAGRRFGRNIPFDKGWPDEARLLDPNPRVISRELLVRPEGGFKPAVTVNTIAAAWLQFMIRDWFGHGKGDAANAIEVELPEGDDWPAPPLIVPRTPPDPTRPAGSTGHPPTFVNSESPWWDASQLYGTRLETQRFVRSGEDGKLRLGPDGLLAIPDDPKHDPGNEPGWWLGLEMLFTLFFREHNAICDRLRAEYPTWSDEELFQRARLVNAALIAKIHTAEWTPAVISHPTTVTALKANWWGLAGERIHKLLGRVSSDEAISGIPGSETNHFGVPYSLTEEFAAVYRMHPLIRDEYSLRRTAGDEEIRACTFRDLTGRRSHELMQSIPLADLYYSFGTEHPGDVVLHNFPRFLQEFERPDGKLADIAATDIVRTREQGVPRYNAFRRLLHLEPARSFEELVAEPEWAAELSAIYADVEDVDLMVGMFAEKRPTGFAFSDTAFRIFILMASRRLNSDRFYTRDYRAGVYTQAGLDWIDDNDMTTVLLRHLPELRASMRGVDNAFAPWHRAGEEWA